ncbi:MAG: prepilin peptidase [Clostridiales bacterium]|nr:prepilin peptidase [Clostridiales bacterium]
MDPVNVIYILYCVYAFLFGIVIGSFLNVVIYRLPVGRTIAKGHSMCMTCGHNLGPLDLVPLFSWLFLKGKCRYCGAPIASRYAKIESLTGIIFLINALTHLDAAFIFVDMSAFFICLFLISVIYSLCFCTLISAMMIWYDTEKSFWALSILPLTGNILIALLTSAAFGNIASGIIPVLINLGYILLFIIIQFLLGYLIKHDYKITDLKSDITISSLFTMNCFLNDSALWYNNMSLMIIGTSVFAIIYSLFNNLTKGKKANRYKMILALAVIVIFSVARFFVLKAVYNT